MNSHTLPNNYYEQLCLKKRIKFSVQRGVVTFNQYLVKAKPACIKYVILHELVHFIYLNRSKLFYDFLSIHMPNWKE